MEIPTFVLSHFNIDIDETIHGGEATIFIGDHFSHGKVAAKKWHKNYYETNKETVLKREIQILMGVGKRSYGRNPHQHIIKVIGLLINKQSHYIGYVMPCMEIGNLGDVIHDTSHKYDESQVNNWIVKICCGLSHLHSNNIIHRDIKPSNILLGESYDDVKLSDFGIARSVDDMTHSLTTSIGTNFYMAPELLKQENYTFSADIYSLSITIWEILHRRIPYDHVTSNYSLLYQISKGERPELKNDLSEEMSNFLTRYWNDDVTQRPEINEILKSHRSTRLTPSQRAETEEKKQTILLLGGDDGMDNESLIMLENNGWKWKELNITLPDEISHHGAQFLNNNLYIFGGCNKEEGILNSTYKLSKSLKWEEMAYMSQERSEISNSSVVLNNQIWVCGGWDAGALKSVEMYDPGTNKWKYMEQMNVYRSDAATAVVNGKIFCAGGYQLNSVEYYDPSSDVWTLICNMPQYINGHCAIEIDGDFIIIGGWNSNSANNSKNVWALDTTDKDAVWIEKPSMSTPRGHFNIAKIDGKIFVCGGGSAGDSVEIFDGRIWKKGPLMPTYRRDAAAVVIPMEFARSLKE